MVDGQGDPNASAEFGAAIAAPYPAAYRLKFASPQRLGRDAEGLCVQTLHIGPFDAEAETLRRTHREFIPPSGLTMTGRHQEVRLSDFRRTDPAKLRTVLRRPVVETDGAHEADEAKTADEANEGV